MPKPIDAPATATLAIDSEPQGATVVGPDGKELGVTPLHISWPIGTAAVAFELRLAGYKNKTKDIVVGGNTSLRIELEKLPEAPKPTRPTTPVRPPAHPPAHTDGVVKPGDI